MFHISKAKTRALLGGNRSSKTYSHVQDYAMQFVGDVPKSLSEVVPQHRLDPTRKLRFCMEDYPNSFTKVVYPYIQQLIPSDAVSDVVKDSGRIRAITNTKGGFIEFMYYDQETTKHGGTSRHAVGYDEEPPESIRDEGLMRLVDTDGEETFSLTPVSGALRYLYDDIYLRRGREVEKNYDLIMNDKGVIVDAYAGEMTDKTIPGGDPEIDVFFACIFDNIAIKKHAAIRILQKFDKDEMIMRAKGHFMFLSGLVYKQYSDAIHLIEPFTDWFEGVYKDDYTLYVAIDPHPRTPHAVLFLCVRRDGLHFIVDEMFSDCTAPELVEGIKSKCRGKIPEYIIIDPIASAPDPSTKSCLRTDLIDFGLNTPYPIAASKDKVRGIVACKKRLQVNDKGIPGIYMSSNCTRFRYEITRFAWDDWRKDTQNTKGQKQKPVDKDDHMMENWYRLENLEMSWVSHMPYYEEPFYIQETGKSRVTGY
ncbi:MAG: hypothetical protein DDT23_01066 [candidate division WS2 bacterium]|nr:hypothetical protein [Candidatus Lithacetigena glycinireducens]